MAREKKKFLYEFNDGIVEIPATYIAKCNVTGEEIPIYHKFLVKMIENKYNNNFKHFVATFTKKGAVKPTFNEQGVEIDRNSEDSSLNAYSDYLIVCFKSLRDNPVAEDDVVAFAKHERAKQHLKNCFQKHFNGDIENYIPGTTV